MASSGCFCTLNPECSTGNATDTSTRRGGVSHGNLKYVNQTGNTMLGTMGVTSGKWYYEMYIVSQNADNGMSVGWANEDFCLNAELGYNSPNSGGGGDSQAFGWYSQTNNLIYGPGNGGSTYNKTWGGGTQMTDGDILGVYLDADNGKFWAAKNGTVFNSGNPATGTGHGFGTGGSPHNIAMKLNRVLFPAIGNWSVADATVYFNFGQDSSFGGNKSTGTASAADGNGFGDFYYTPATGFNALCSANQPCATAVDPIESDASPQNFFDVVTYTGNGTSQSISTLNFSPNWVLIKNRDQTDAWLAQNTITGVNTTKVWDTSAATSTETDCITSFDSNGFSISNDHKVNANTEKYVAYCWKESADVGFDIVSYSGNSSSTQAISHGLGANPDAIIMASNTGSNVDTTLFINTPNAGTSYGVFPTLNNAQQTSTYVSAISSSTFTVANAMNTDGRTYIAYVFRNIDGFQRFGEYRANGNDTSSNSANTGPTIFTGFRPKLVVIKTLDSTGNWQVFDTERPGKLNTTAVGNPHINPLEWDTSDTENSHGNGQYMDCEFFSNGFRMNDGNGAINHPAGNDYIYLAWADVPFKFNNPF